ncbi:MAG: tryptophan synthase subunit alpha [Lentisphaeria bacterium]|nr:tryptophan synthase subunit alpha [Lentisphaeria bacterium]
MTRLQKIFGGNKKVLVIFDSCGAPTMEESERRLESIIESGADIVELGIPFSDPVADGPVIQKASQTALANGATLEKILKMASRIRKKHPETGLIFFGYCNVFLQYGWEKLFSELALLEADGILVVDLPYEERDEILPFCRKYGIPQIPLIGPSTDLERAKKLLAEAEGFAYCINARGVTGARKTLPPELAARLEALKKISPIPVASGFGISDGKSAFEVAHHTDAVVVGSAAVRLPLPELAPFVRSLKEAISGI